MSTRSHTSTATAVAPGQTWHQKGNREPLYVLKGGAHPDEWLVCTEGVTITLTTHDLHLGYVLAHR